MRQINVSIAERKHGLSGEGAAHASRVTSRGSRCLACYVEAKG